MVNLRKLLTNICESIYELLNWKNVNESIINTLYGSPTGTVISDSIDSSVSLTNDTWTELISLTLTPGVWYIIGRGTFAYNNTGFRAISITTHTAADGPASTSPTIVQDPLTEGSGTTMLTISSYAYLSTDTVYRLLARQKSGAKLNVTTSALVATKIAEYPE